MPTDKIVSEGTWAPEGAGENGTFSTLPPDVAEAGERRPEAGAPAERYQWVGRLGEGGMGEVWRVKDRALGRVVAMKVLRHQLLASPRGLARFEEEAQVAAQLQHPGIVPVHDVGRLPDGRVYFTMKEVIGRTLEDVSRDVHRAGPRGAAVAFRRLADAFLRVCEAVAYAHHRGVVHRDLKPANVMLGDFGEVLVLDWGLAKVLGEGDEAEEPLATARTEDDAFATRVGTVTGTPAYMSPEQARGETHGVGPRSDVYALGATLYELLTDRPPYLGATAAAVIDQAASGAPIALASAAGGVIPVPEELDRVCERALAHRPEDRFPNAGALAEAFAAWLDGARKRDRALKLVAEAADATARAHADDVRAEALRAEARARLADVPETAPEEQKWPGWDLEDQARAAEASAARQRVEALQVLQSALSHDPDCAEAHEALADAYRRQHAALEAKGRRDEAARIEPWLRAHDRGRHAAYLRGDGAVTLVTDPEGAEVDLYRFELQRRRLVPVFDRSLGRTPLVAVTLPMGSYLLKIRAPGRVEADYPVLIGRQEHWDGVAPGESEPFPIRLLRPDELAEDDVYVPAGWFWSGGELEQLTDPVPWRRVWAHPFVIKRHPVTNAEYLDFLNALVAEGRLEDALAAAPPAAQLPGAIPPMQPNPDGFLLGSDGSVIWAPEVPVVRISWYSAAAFARWQAESSRMPWQLPFELEWEKAARGVDGRIYPWGEEIDAAWCRMRTSWTTQPGPVGIHVYPQDTSLYWVNGMTGNVCQWTQDPRPGGCSIVGHRIDLTPSTATARRIRGGSWNHNPWFCRIDVRKLQLAKDCVDGLGFRISRPL